MEIVYGGISVLVYTGILAIPVCAFGWAVRRALKQTELTPWLWIAAAMLGSPALSLGAVYFIFGLPIVLVVGVPSAALSRWEPAKYVIATLCTVACALYFPLAMREVSGVGPSIAYALFILSALAGMLAVSKLARMFASASLHLGHRYPSPTT
jgi:hypothetical protein